MDKSIVELIFELKFACMSKEESIREKLKLSPAEYRGLLSIQPGQVVSCMQLSGEMGLSKSRGSRVVDKLISGGYLKEVKNEGDKRVFNITLTKSGERALKEINGIMSECETTILKNVPKPELNSFTRTLHKISEILKPV